MVKTVRIAVAAVVWSMVAFVQASGAADEPMVLAYQSLADLSIEQLMEISVTTASKHEERSFESAAAIFVVTSEDIHRSGATSIPEALRMVPGMDVFNIDLNNYHVTVRGHSDLVFTDRLLVLLDGRAVQSPTFSVVWWQALNYPLEDIDRIEVVRGPGTSLWGANAMNGVINIVTKKAGQTQGLLVSGGFGNRERAFGTLRQGGRTKGGTDYRWYFMTSETPDGRNLRDEYSFEPQVGEMRANHKNMFQGGYRADWEEADASSSLIANIHDVRAWAEGTYIMNIDPSIDRHGIHQDSFTGQNILYRREMRGSGGLNTTMQFYYDRSEVKRITFGEEDNTFDAELQTEYQLADWNKLVAGLNARTTYVRWHDTVAMEMPDHTVNLYGFFMQDEMRFASERLRVTPGIKVERNQYTGWQPQPSLRAAWVENDWMTWVAVSRAVRLPNSVSNRLTWRYQTDGTAPDGLPYVARSIGQGGVMPEEMYAYEAGLRMKAAQNVGLNLSTYLNRDRNTVDTISNSSNLTYETTPTPHWAYDYNNYDNLLEGDTYGAELRVDIQPQPWLKTFVGYTYTRVLMRPKPGKESSDTYTFAEWINTATPLYTLKGGVFTDLPGHFRLDAMGYYNAEALDFAYPYTFRLDLAIAYSPTPSLEVALVGRNLLKEMTRESQQIESVVEPIWMPRDYYLKVTYSY